MRDHIQAESLKPQRAKVEDDAISLDQYVRNLGATDKTIQMINLWVTVMHGVSSTEESAAFFIDYCRRNKGLLSIRADDKTGGNYQRLHRGKQIRPHPNPFPGRVTELQPTGATTSETDLLKRIHICQKYLLISS